MIQTQQQYEWALHRVEELLPLVDDNTPTTDPNSIELELLSNMVADYSDTHFSIGEPTLSDASAYVRNEYNTGRALKNIGRKSFENK